MSRRGETDIERWRERASDISIERVRYEQRGETDIERWRE